jgi:hypothetical protein
MYHERFHKAGDEFLAWINSLRGAATSIFPQARSFLEGDNPRPMDMEREQAAECALRDVGKRIEDVMSSFDAVLESIGMPPRYKAFFDSSDSGD